MSKYLLFSSKAKLRSVAFILVFAFYSSTISAQCAGDDNSITICDIPNPSSRSINLFSALLGTPVAGGTWSDDDLTNALNPVTGVLNAQLILESGLFHYTYTVIGISGCTDNSSTITVLVGAYSGGDTLFTAQVCGSDSRFNLFQVFDSSAVSPQSNGVWFNDTTGTAVDGSSISPISMNIGVYDFTYTIPSIGTCDEKKTRSRIRLIKPSKSGSTNNILLCSSDYLTFDTNLDLNTRLSDNDPGGRWSESGGTSELTFTSDHNINILNIYNTRGAGTYTFGYTVNAPQPCSPPTSVLQVIIERQLDFTGAKLVINSDICEDAIPIATYSATLTQGLQTMFDGEYNITYQVSGPNGETKTILADFISGVLTFPLPSTYFQQVGAFNVAITNVTKVSDTYKLCKTIIKNLNDDLIINPLPRINDSVLTIDPVCQNVDALVQMSGMGNLVDGNFRIVYNLLGANLLTGQTAIINVVGGISDFTIPTSLIPNAGKTTISITNITNLTTGCTNTVIKTKEFVVKPLPIITNLSASVKSVCENQPVSVSILGLGTLTNASINYILSGTNTSTGQTLVLTITNGTATFVIPKALVANTGLTTFSITNLTDTVNGCGVDISTINSNFTIFTLPTAPIASDKSFCKTDKATVANLVPLGAKYQWFDSATATTPLLNAAVLVSGDYYVREVNPTTLCESTKTKITVTINDLQSPTLNPKGENFCGLDKPTLQQLSNNTVANGTLIWFDAPSGGKQLPNATLLVEGATYYGFDFSGTLNCFSTNALPVTVTLLKCDTTTNPPEVKYDFFIPDAFSPNGDGVNDNFEIPKIDFLYPDYTLDIYNRYGSLMFQGNKNTPSWDGKNSQSTNLIDVVAPNGIYFYVINFNKDNKSPLQGRLYLNR
jgi:gliding motility-associated-like protein